MQDATRGSVVRINFPALTGSDFVGLNFQDPQNYDPSSVVGKGYDLTPATTIQFDVRSPNAAMAQFGVGSCVTIPMSLPLFWTTKIIALNALGNPPFGAGVCV